MKGIKVSIRVKGLSLIFGRGQQCLVMKTRDHREKKGGFLGKGDRDKQDEALAKKSRHLKKRWNRPRRWSKGRRRNELKRRDRV